MADLYNVGLIGKISGESAFPVSNTVGLGESASLAMIADMEYGGNGMIDATVAIKGTPANVPAMRRVTLHRERDGVMIRETVSDAAGNYYFKNIDAKQKYYAVAHDHTRTYRPAIADSLQPEIMP